MYTGSLRLLSVSSLLLICFCTLSPRSEAQVTGLMAPDDSGAGTRRKEDSWIVEFDKQIGTNVHTMELVLYPKPEPRPALKIRLLPDDFDLVDGNAAVYYLKAEGFFEQSWARMQLNRIRTGARERAEKEGKDVGEMPPFVWLSTPPDKLPLKEVKEYLRLTSFQAPLLREAARRRVFDADRHLREVDDVIGYLLPAMQAMRELARTQSLRCRVAIAEGRVEDAIAIIGQQFALARHLGQDDFLVSNLVGIAIAGTAWNDALYLVQHPNTPNLYWAIAAMPVPLVDIRQTMALERQFLYLQLKVLREVDETPRPAGYWQDFLDRLVPQFGQLASEFDLPPFADNPELARATLVGYIAAAYPGAKDYLINECEMTLEQVEAYPTAQVVFLAMVRFYDQWRDEYFKWTHVPFWQARANASRRGMDHAIQVASNRYGWCSMPASRLLPAIFAVRTAEASFEQRIALLQTVEAIRLFAATHDGKLPTSLDKLSVPAPLEPFTGKPIDYECRGSHAVLQGHSLPGLCYRLVVRLAEPPE